MRMSDWSSDVCSSDLLCPYHDQALAPFKALHFHDGVNLTLGLPIVRTSPDHGTAFNIAGRGRADPGPTIAAIAMAARMAAAREQSRADRRSVGSGKSVTIRVDLGGGSAIKKKNKN